VGLDDISSLLPSLLDAKADKSLLSGQTVPSYPNIIIGEPIGKGGFGQVYRAIDTANGRTLAVKVVDKPTGPRLQKLLESEIRLQKVMSNDPAVPALHCIGKDSSFVYLVMVSQHT
jgi:serine/threonine protein kinase